MFKKDFKCTICKERVATIKSSTCIYFCENCQEIYCNFCKKVLSKEEKNFLPLYRNQKLCIGCLKKALQEEKIKILNELESELDFQIRYQTCYNCGKINDSRNEKNEVWSRYCSFCRKEYGNELYVKWLHKIHKKRIFKEKKKIIFDKTYGFVEKK